MQRQYEPGSVVFRIYVRQNYRSLMAEPDPSRTADTHLQRNQSPVLLRASDWELCSFDCLAVINIVEDMYMHPRTTAFGIISALILCLAGPFCPQARSQAAYTLVDLGALPGGTTSQGWAVNARGDVVGDADIASGSNHASLF